MELPEDAWKATCLPWGPEDMVPGRERILERMGHIEVLTGDRFMKDVLGDHIYTKYLEAKRKGGKDFQGL